MEKKIRYTLGKEERLKSRKAIEQLFKEGKPLSLFPLRVVYQFSATQPEQPGQALQAGFTVSTKYFKKATDRNRIRRLMKEAYRLQKNELQESQVAKADKLAVFFIYVGKELPDYLLVFEKMRTAIQRLLKLTGEPQ